MNCNVIFTVEGLARFLFNKRFPHQQTDLNNISNMKLPKIMKFIPFMDKKP